MSVVRPVEPHAARRLLGSRIWIVLLGSCVVIIGGADTLLLALSTGILTTGYNAVVMDTFGLIMRFVLGAVVLDLFLVTVLWTLLLPLLTRVSLAPERVFALTASATLGIGLGIGAVRYEVFHRIGYLANLDVVRDLLSSSLLDALGGVFATAPGLAAAALGVSSAAIAIAAVLAVTDRVAAHLPDPSAAFEPPRFRIIAAAAALLGILAILVLSASSEEMFRVRAGLKRKSSSVALRTVVDWATDIDRDGYGVLLGIRDPRPFDADVYPHAVDIPGNAVDENRLAGDHPVGYRFERPVWSSGFRGEARPHLLLIYLESFRADLVGRRLNGREITPFLNRLAREGSHSEHFYVHTPFTAQSRAQLFRGKLNYRSGESTLIDDFKARGYRVAHFSGQDDSFGGSEELLGVHRADVFYDARQDKDRRTTLSSHSASLQISSKLLLERVLAFLPTHQPDEPLFLYVNFVDTHYPYHHKEIEPLLGVVPVSRREIRSRNAERVRETYANTAAAVDRAIEKLVQAWERQLGGADRAIVVTADHGQALYEGGYLGHGRALDDFQTHVPLILWRIGGDWPEPLGPADLRPLIRRNLGVERQARPPRARFLPDPERSLVQYLPTFERPALFGLRTLQGTVLFDFPAGLVKLIDPDGRTLEFPPQERMSEFESVIWSWEALRLAE